MAGALTISTLNNDTGVLATQNGMTGIAKAWVNFNGTGTPAINGSFNVSSITDNGTGNYTVNFTTALPDANYSVVCQSSTQTTGTSEGRSSLASPRDLATTSYRQLTTSASDGSQTDAAIVCVSVFSS